MGKSRTGWRQALATDPEATQQQVSRLIRNTYRTLMSRGMKSGCCWRDAVQERGCSLMRATSPGG